MSFEVPEWGATDAFAYHLDLSNDTPKVENLVSQAMMENDRKRENDGSSPKKPKKKQKVSDVQLQKNHYEPTEKTGKKKRKKGEKTDKKVEKNEADGSTKNGSCSMDVDEAAEPPAKKRCKNKYKELNEEQKKRKHQAVNTVQKEAEEKELPLSSSIVPSDKSEKAQDQLVRDLENGNITKAKKKKKKTKEVEAKASINGANDPTGILQPTDVNGAPKKRKKHKKSGSETVMEESGNETKGDTSVAGTVEETVNRATGAKKASKQKKAQNELVKEETTTETNQETVQKVNKNKKSKKKQNEDMKEGNVPVIETENFNVKGAKAKMNKEQNELCVNETKSSVEEAVKSKDEIGKPKKSKKQKKIENEAVMEAEGQVLAPVVETAQVKGVNGIPKKKKQKNKNKSAKEDGANETNGEAVQAENINEKTKKTKKQKKAENEAAKVESMNEANQEEVQAKNIHEMVKKTKKQKKTQNEAVKAASNCKDTKNVEVMKDILQVENRNENLSKKQKKKQKKALGESSAVVKKESGMAMQAEGVNAQLNKNKMLKNALAQAPVKENGKKKPKAETESSKKLIIEEETVQEKKEKKKKKKKKPKNEGEKALLKKDPNFRAELDTFLDSLDLQQEDIDTEDEEEWQEEEEENGDETLPDMEDSEEDDEREEKAEPINEKSEAIKDKKSNKKQIAESLEVAEDIEENKGTPKKDKKFDKKRLSEILKGSSDGDETKQEELVLTPKEKLKLKMTNQLSAARFRMLNEELYKTTSDNAVMLFKEDPEAFHTYHHGYQNQVAQWPINPLDLIIKWLNKKSKDWVVADFGCGEAKLAASVHQKKVHSFDLVAANKRVIACDMANTPLPAASVNVAVFCLSLMGTNITDFIVEANRVLKEGGIMKIAEVESRFTDVKEFISQINKMGFQCTYKNIEQKFFHCFDFKKEKNIKKKAACPSIVLNPCLYKKR